MTLTLSSIVTSVTNSVNGFVPDLGVFIAAGVVLGLAALVGKKLIKAGR